MGKGHRRSAVGPSLARFSSMPAPTASISLAGDGEQRPKSSSTSPGMRPSPSRAALLARGGFDTEAPRTRSPSPARGAGAGGTGLLASIKAILGTAGGPPSPATKAAACLAYGGVSVCITIFNKAVFSTHGFPYPAFVTLLQVKRERGRERAQRPLRAPHQGGREARLSRYAPVRKEREGEPRAVRERADSARFQNPRKKRWGRRASRLRFLAPPAPAQAPATPGTPPAEPGTALSSRLQGRTARRGARTLTLFSLSLYRYSSRSPSSPASPAPASWTLAAARPWPTPAPSSGWLSSGWGTSSPASSPCAT